MTGSGNGATYPVKAILGAKVCAYKWQNKEGRSTDTDCNTVAFPGGNSDHLWLRFKTIQVSGSSRPNPACAVGNPLCSYYSVRLIN